MANIETSNVKPETHFSWLRTRLSAERTLMSWLRTGTALIGFGFTIFQFLERFNEMPGVAAARHEGTPRSVGLMMIAIGTIGVAGAAAHYRMLLRHLHSPEFEQFAGIRKPSKLSPTLVAAIMLVLVGIGAFYVVFTRTT